LFENKQLTTIFGHIRKAATGAWRKLDSEVIHDMYSSTNTIRVIRSWKMRWAGDVGCLGGRGRIVYKILIRSLKLFGRPRCRWEDNIKIRLKGIGWNGVEWIDVAWDREGWRRVD
jgi:hypothetical protein